MNVGSPPIVRMTRSLASVFSTCSAIFGQILFNEQTEIEMRIKLAVMLTEVRTLNRGNIRHSRTDGGRNETMIAKCAVCRIDPYPSGTGKENINPGMQTALRSSILNINVKLAKETAHHPDGQTDLPQDRRAKQRGIPAGARPQFDGPGRQPRFSFGSYFVRNFAVQRIGELDQRIDGVRFSVQLPDFSRICFFFRIDDPVRGQDPVFFRRVLKRKLKRARGEQEMKRILRPEFNFEFDADLQNLARLWQKTICYNVIKQVPAILDITFEINDGLKLVRGDRLVHAGIKPNCVRRETHRFLVGITHPVFNFDVHKNRDPNNKVVRCEPALVGPLFL